MDEPFKLVVQLATRAAQRQPLSRAETSAFLSFVHERLLENDRELLRKFQGRSSLATYLSAVIERLLLDYRVRIWQGWQPSVHALQRGAIAVLLERLVLRDGHSVTEAIQSARRNYGVTQTNEQLRALWAGLQRLKH